MTNVFSLFMEHVLSPLNNPLIIITYTTDPFNFKPVSRVNLVKQRASIIASVNAMHYASVMKIATTLYSLAFQLTRFPIIMKAYPMMDFHLSKYLISLQFLESYMICICYNTTLLTTIPCAFAVHAYPFTVVKWCFQGFSIYS